MFNIFKSVAEVFTPVLGESQFYKSGVLTPEEFVLAGDLLVQKCPNWQWYSGTTQNGKSYLPESKQFLTAKGVACFSRAATFGENDSLTSTVEDGEDWLVPETAKPTTQGNGDAAVVDKKEEIEELDDLDTFDYDDQEKLDINGAEDVEVVASSEGKRLYDMSIVYDKYYRTPRVYLVGYNLEGVPLSPAEMQQDVSTDHRDKTVTVEQHPFLKNNCLSIHPCRHSHTMMRMLALMTDEEEQVQRRENEQIKRQLAEEQQQQNQDKALFGNLAVEKTKRSVLTEDAIAQKASQLVQKKMPVDKYLLLFLKFIATVIPTVDYDQTASLELF